MIITKYEVRNNVKYTTTIMSIKYYEMKKRKIRVENLESDPGSSTFICTIIDYCEKNCIKKNCKNKEKNAKI